MVCTEYNDNDNCLHRILVIDYTKYRVGPIRICIEIYMGLLEFEQKIVKIYMGQLKSYNWTSVQLNEHTTEQVYNWTVSIHLITNPYSL